MLPKTLTKNVMTPFISDDFFRPWNQWFEDRNQAAMMTMPAVNVTEDEKNYVISLAAPGLKKSDFNIALEGNLLTVSSIIEDNKEESGEKYTRKEYSYSSFSRSFNMPEDVMQEMIEANYENGVLRIMLPRMESPRKDAMGKTITVK